ncbi:hypothetical protein [Polycladidibacter stylochi]|uniref:hypothetical protein n=1 Tax=Polycladidibacter stylochi TaxID=1807766 RepID=UPI0012E358B5|nr:hypothetical protein [Pseudovibrio stylochi]
MRLLLFLVMSFVVSTLKVNAEPKPTFSFHDWTVYIDEVDTGEDVRLTCNAFTRAIGRRGRGQPTVTLSISNGDVGPPHVYPHIYYEDFTHNGRRPVISVEKPTRFVFDNGIIIPALGHGFTDEYNIKRATATAAPELLQPLLRAMRRNKTMSIYGGDQLSIKISLRGFTAAYIKLMDVCGFSSYGVIDPPFEK